MRELALELALLGPSLGFSTLSCVVLGKSWNLFGPDFPHQEKEGFYIYCYHCFLVRLKCDN